MSIYAIAVDKTGLAAQYRLASQDGVTKLAPESLILSNAIKVDNLEVVGGRVVSSKPLPEIARGGCINSELLTILKREYITYTVCNFEGKIAKDCLFSDIKGIKFTNADLKVYMDINGMVSKAYEFNSESYEQFVDNLLEEALKVRAALNNGSLEKVVDKLNLVGDSSAFIISEDGVLSKNKDINSGKLLEVFKVPQGVRVIQSYPDCKRLVGCSTVEAYTDDRQRKDSMECIDLSMCDLITNIEMVANVVKHTGVKDIYMPKNIKVLKGVGVQRKAGNYYFGGYIEEIGDRGIESTYVHVYLEAYDMIRRIGKSALYKQNSFIVDFKECISLQQIDSEAFMGNEDERDIDLSNCRCLESIGTKAFYGHKSKAIRLPDNLRHIGTDAFRVNYETRCEPIVYINFPKSLTKASTWNLAVNTYDTAAHTANRFRVRGEAEDLVIDIPINLIEKYEDSFTKLLKLSYECKAIKINKI